MRTAITIIYCLFFFLAKSQILEQSNFDFRGSKFDIVVIKIDSLLANKFVFLQNDSNKNEPEFFKAKESYFAITASIVDSNCSPLGLYIDNHIQKHELNSSQGVGNFFIPVNGVFAIRNSGEILVQSSKEFNLNLDYRIAIQSGPMLIINDQINPNFDMGSKNKNYRTAVGIVNDTSGSFLIFVKSIDPVSFYDLSFLLKSEYRCQSALTLESGFRCSLRFPFFNKLYDPGVFCCKYLAVTF
jgi:uncharacterized protein YigE (DUF2233 family)